MQGSTIVRDTIKAYDDSVTRAYCRARFQILRQRFLDEIGQYLPSTGDVLDIGCGFGLFSLYYAQMHPEVSFHGIDRNAKRIAEATRAAERLGLKNTQYEVGDATELCCNREYQGAYMLDIVHHIPPAAVTPLLAEVSASLVPGARLLVKDVDRNPAYKRLFTHLMDKVVDPHCPVSYWAKDDLVGVLSGLGLEVYTHAMVDYLPYPHMLYVCQK